MLDSTLIVSIFLIWLLTFLISLTKKRLRKIVIQNGLIAVLYSTILFAISVYIDGRDSMIYIMFALVLLGIHFIYLLIYTLFIVLYRPEKA